MKTVNTPIPEDQVELNDVMIERFLKEAIDISPEALEEEFVRVPADLAYWNERYAVSLRMWLSAKVERERIMGELLCDPLFIEELEEKLQKKKPSVDQIKGAILNHKSYITARISEAANEAEKTRLRGCVDAVASKRDMLISLGAHVRLEMQHDPVLRSRLAGMRDMRESEAE